MIFWPKWAFFLHS